MLSIIVTYHEEGQAFLQECITQIQQSVGIPHEIIVVDDHSIVPLQAIEGTTIIRHETNKGVGQAFDTGIGSAIGDDIIFTACDTRYVVNDWAEKLVKEINDHPESLICTGVVGLNREKPENMDFERRRKIMRCYGATILMFHDKKSNPKKESTFRGIIEAKWHPLNKESLDKSYEIPCILGACYGVKKSWYRYIDGFWGHRQWGTLEPYLSLKSWLFGGDCRVAPYIETAHIFKREGVHGITQDSLIYNKMMIATLLLDDYQRYIDFLGTNSIVERAREMYKSDLPKITAKKEEYKSKMVYNIKDFARRFNIDLRDEAIIQGI